MDFVSLALSLSAALSSFFPFWFGALLYTVPYSQPLLMWSLFCSNFIFSWLYFDFIFRSFVSIFCLFFLLFRVPRARTPRLQSIRDTKHWTTFEHTLSIAKIKWHPIDLEIRSVNYVLTWIYLLRLVSPPSRSLARCCMRTFPLGNEIVFCFVFFIFSVGRITHRFLQMRRECASPPVRSSTTTYMVLCEIRHAFCIHLDFEKFLVKNETYSFWKLNTLVITARRWSLHFVRNFWNLISIHARFVIIIKLPAAIHLIVNGPSPTKWVN